MISSADSGCDPDSDPGIECFSRPTGMSRVTHGSPQRQIVSGSCDRKDRALRRLLLQLFPLAAAVVFHILKMYAWQAGANEHYFSLSLDPLALVTLQLAGKASQSLWNTPS